MDQLQVCDACDLLTGSDDFLGKGSYAKVRKCFFRKLEKLVAVKCFPAGNEARISQNLISTEKEAKILSKIKHENIVRTLGITKWTNYIGIITELLSCGSLENLLSMHDVDVSWKLRLRFFLEIADALNYLHCHDPTRSYIHGDIKPQNILLNNKLSIKLADFGATFIAQATGAYSLSMTSHENTQHTPLYTAPEYLKEIYREKTTSMDVYSYGMNGYEIISRKQVFSGSAVSPQVLLSLIEGKGQKPNLQFVDDVGEQCCPVDFKVFLELKRVMLQCWETDPELRPQISKVWETLKRLAQSHDAYNEQTIEEAKKISQQIIGNQNDTKTERIPLDQYNDSSFSGVEKSLFEASMIVQKKESVTDVSESGKDKTGASKALTPPNSDKEKAKIVQYVMHYDEEDQYCDDDGDNYHDDLPDDYNDIVDALPDHYNDDDDDNYHDDLPDDYNDIVDALPDHYSDDDDGDNYHDDLPDDYIDIVDALPDHYSDDDDGDNYHDDLPDDYIDIVDALPDHYSDDDDDDNYHDDLPDDYNDIVDALPDHYNDDDDDNYHDDLPDDYNDDDDNYLDDY